MVNILKVKLLTIHYTCRKLVSLKMILGKSHVVAPFYFSTALVQSVPLHSVQNYSTSVAIASVTICIINVLHNSAHSVFNAVHNVSLFAFSRKMLLMCLLNVKMTDCTRIPVCIKSESRFLWLISVDRWITGYIRVWLPLHVVRYCGIIERW